MIDGLEGRMKQVKRVYGMAIVEFVRVNSIRVELMSHEQLVFEVRIATTE